MRGDTESGLSLVELIVTVAILSILASAAIPIMRFRVQREKERELRYDLWQMRDAIDKYKDAADLGQIPRRCRYAGLHEGGAHPGAGDHRSCASQHS